MKKVLLALCVSISVLAQAQNVGIGTLTPAYKLDVTGTINADTLRLSGRQVLRIASPSGVYRNLYVGDSAGFSNTTGFFSTFVGGDAGRNNTTGYRNCFVGGLAGYQNVTGHDNSFFGISAGQNNISSQNTFVGSAAGYTNTGGNNNTFIGNSAGSLNNNGFNNSFFGSEVGLNNDGSDNTFIGMFAGNANTTGFGNNVLGANADFGSANLTNATAIGYQSFVSGSNSLVLGSISGVNGATSSVNVGIGTSSPTSPLHVVSSAGNIMQLDGGTGMYTAILENGLYRGYIGSYAGNPEDVDFGTGVGNSTGKLHLTIQATPKFTLDAAGNVGIGNTSPVEKLDVAGNIKLTGEIVRPSTGASNLVPIAYGNVASNGAINSGSGNFTASRLTTGLYLITITGESYQFQTYTTVVTPTNSTSAILATTGSGAGQLQVYTWNAAGTATDSQFHFVVYKQ